MAITHGAASRGNLDKKEVVAERTARLILLQGLDAVTHSKVARASGVSRPWLYKYIGRERADLIRFTARHFGVRLAEFDNRPRLDRRSHWIEDTVEGVRIMVRESSRAPWVLPLYFRYVGSKNPIGDCIAELEARYLVTCAEEIVTALDADAERARWLAELIHAARLGIVYRQVTAGFAADPEMEQLSEQFRRWLETL